MKCLTLTEPWATLISIGAKRIETRSWATYHRGLLAIHSAKGFPKEARELCWQEPFATPLKELRQAQIRAITRRYEQEFKEIVEDQQGNKCERINQARLREQEALDKIGQLPLGCIIAVCELVECIRITPANTPTQPERGFGDYTPGRFAWYLENVRPLPEPIPVRGYQRLWTLPEEVEQEVLTGLAKLNFVTVEGEK